MSEETKVRVQAVAVLLAMLPVTAGISYFIVGRFFGASFFGNVAGLGILFIAYVAYLE